MTSPTAAIQLSSDHWAAIETFARRHDCSALSVKATLLAILVERFFELSNAPPATIVIREPFDENASILSLTTLADGWPGTFALIDAVRSAPRHRVPIDAGAAEHLDGTLQVRFVPSADQSAGAVVLDRGPTRLSAIQAQSLLSAFPLLLDQALQAPQQPVQALRLALAYDRAAEHPRAPTPATSAVADLGAAGGATGLAPMAGLFAQIVRRWPDKVAIAWPEGALTFRDVARRAGELAGQLTALGARPGDILAFRLSPPSVPQSVALYHVAQIAAFQLRCAIMPLAQQTTPSAAAEQARTLGPRFIIAASGGLDFAWRGAGPQSVEPIAGFPSAALIVNDAPPPPEPDVRGAAVYLTSSGTTGTPKTIRLTQASLLSFLDAIVSTGVFPAAPGLLAPNVGFDVCLLDCWLPWGFGHHFVILPGDRRTARSFREAFALGARIASVSPTYATASMAERPDCFDGYAAIVLAGEVVPPILSRRLAEACPQTMVVNGYGPAECTVLSTLCVLRGDEHPTTPIGFGLPGYRVLIADEHARPAPRGWPGEILIASGAPSGGYYDPHMTLERFVELPGESSGPFFRSGDFGWVDGEGRVQFIGRRDRQVKVNGVRIELDGVEHRIAEVDGVADAAVVDIRHGSRHILAAIVEPRSANADPSDLAGRIAAACRSWLPRTAILSDILFVDSLPTGATGKKDYLGLQAWAEAHHRRRIEGASRPGKTPPIPGSLEDAIAQAWLDLFKSAGSPIDAVYCEDDVFSLGATSLDAVIMAATLEERLNVKIQDDVLFLHRTIASQAKALRPNPSDGPEAAEPHLIRRSEGPLRAGAVLCMPLIGGETSYAGALAAFALRDHDVWAFSESPPGGSLFEPRLCFDCARRIADRVLALDALAFTAFIGFSIGGYMAWLVDRMLVAAGREPTPIVNFEGGALHEVDTAWRRRTAALIDPRGPQRPSRMLIVHKRGAGGDPAANAVVAQWRASAVGPPLVIETLDVATVSHIDLISAAVFQTTGDAVEAYVSATARPSTARRAVVLDTAGGRLFQLLTGSEPPDARQVRSYLAALPSGDVEGDLRLGLICLSLASGAVSEAIDLIDRLHREGPHLRDAVYAKAALLSELGRPLEAARWADDWSRDGPDDPVLLARARRAPSGSGAWPPPFDIHVDSERALDLAAAYGVARFGAERHGEARLNG